MVSRFHVRWVALAALSLAQALAHASDAADVVTLNSSLSGFTFRLVDLTPDDGQTPWLKLNLGPGTGSWGGYSSAGDWEGLFPTTPVSNLDSRDQLGTAEGTSDSISGRSRASAEDLARFASTSFDNPQRSTLSVYGQAQTGNVVSGGRADLYYVDPSSEGNGFVIKTIYSDGGPDFTLSANTRLVVEGNFKYQVDVNRQAATPALQAALDDGSAQLTVESSAWVQLSWAKPLVDLDGTVWGTADEALAAMNAANPTTGFQDFQGPGAGSGSKAFSLSLDNNGSTSLEGTLFGLAKTRFELNAPTAALAAAPVPEPGTYALMGLGMAAIGLATRRRQRA